MVLPPRHHLEHVAKREVLVKRFSSTCTDECLAGSNLLSSSSDPYEFCSKEYFDSYQNCLNCYATLPYMSSDASFFNQLKDSFDSIVSSCNSLGKPVNNPLTVPKLSTTASGGSGTKPAGTTPALPTISNLPTGTKPGSTPASTNPSVAVNDSNNPTSTGPPIGVIVGGAIGGVAVIAGIVLAIFFLRKRNRTSHTSAGAALLPDEPRVTPFQYPIPQTSGNPPPQMQQYNQMGPYGNQLDAASSYSHLPQPQEQYGLQPGPSTKQRFGNTGFSGSGPMYDNAPSTYAPSSYAPSIYAPNSDPPYPQGLSPGPFSSAGSTHESQVFSPTISDHSSLPFASPVPPVPPVPSEQYPTKQPYTQPQEPAAAPQFDCPPAYDDEPTSQPQMSNQASSSSAAQLSAAEMEVISQRVATLINAGGGLPADTPKKS